MDEGVAAVRLQFPMRAKAIDELASWDDVFCDVCRDFAEAQQELAKWRVADDPSRDQRCAEYQELVIGLGQEIENALDAATVLPLHPSGPRPR